MKNFHLILLVFIFSCRNTRPVEVRRDIKEFDFKLKKVTASLHEKNKVNYENAFSSVLNQAASVPDSLCFYSYSFSIPLFGLDTVCHKGMPFDQQKTISLIKRSYATNYYLNDEAAIYILTGRVLKEGKEYYFLNYEFRYPKLNNRVERGSSKNSDSLMDGQGILKDSIEQKLMQESLENHNILDFNIFKLYAM